ncbi:MAG: hypothetical protein JWR26_4092 [Pedosphaera sp.]|nr:hypothetical protein [Pedosphaera sp.]
MVAPTLMLWLYMLALGVTAALSPGGHLPWEVSFVSQLALSIVVASWVLADARKRERRLCYDYDSWVFFAWPVVVPVYLFQTRGPRAFLTLLCFGSLLLIAVVVAVVMALVREFVFS